MTKVKSLFRHRAECAASDHSMDFFLLHKLGFPDDISTSASISLNVRKKKTLYLKGFYRYPFAPCLEGVIMISCCVNIPYMYKSCKVTDNIAESSYREFLQYCHACAVQVYL